MGARLVSAGVRVTAVPKTKSAIGIMKLNPKKTSAPALRVAAEAQLKKQTAARPPKTEAEMSKLQHELEVHQIELEMQNSELLAAHAEITRNLEQFTDLYDFAPVGYFTLGIGGFIHQLNLMGATLLGIDRHRLVGMRFNTLVMEGALNVFNDFLAKVFGDAQLHDLRLTLTPHGGPPVIVRLEARSDATGEFCRMVVIDVTARVQAERLAAESLALSQSILAGIPSAMEIVDLTGNILFQNEAMIKAVDRPVLGQKCWEVYLDNRQQCAHCPLKQPLGIGELKTTEVGGVLGGRTFEIHHIGIKFQGRPAVMELFHDITERQQSAAANTRLAAIVTFSQDAIISKNLDGTITSWNPGAEKIFGYPAAEMVGANIRRLISPDRQAEEEKILATIARGEAVEHFETVRLTRAGRLIDVSVTASPIKDETGQVIGVSKVARNITERKRASEKLKTQAEQLARSNEELTRFNQLMVGREMHVIELKQEINDLCARLGRPQPYALEFMDAAAPETVQNLPPDLPKEPSL